MVGMSEILFLGGRPSLDLVNTLRGRNDDVLGRRDLLADAEGLRDWISRAGDEADWFTLDAPAGMPTDTELADAVHLREAVHDLALGNVEPADLDTVNRLALSQPVPALTWDGTSFAVAGEDGPATVSQVLGLLAADAVNLFATTAPERIKECAQPRCGMVFLDTSRGNRRRWCSMSTCGNRAKVKRFDDRAREAAAGA